MSAHDTAGVLVQAVNDTYLYNSPWWIYLLAAFALFGFVANFVIGLGTLTRFIGNYVQLKKPLRTATSKGPKKESKEEPAEEQDAIERLT